MIRLYCVDGPLAGETIDQPAGYGCSPGLTVRVTVLPHSGHYRASAYDRDSELRWRAFWVAPERPDPLRTETATLAGSRSYARSA